MKRESLQAQDNRRHFSAHDISGRASTKYDGFTSGSDADIHAAAARSNACTNRVVS